MGTPSYAAEILKGLVNSEFEVVGVFTKPDKPVGRKQILTKSEVANLVDEMGLSLPVFKPKSLKDESVTSQILSLKPDFIVVAAYGLLLPKEILQICPCINLHASILPKFRGASPVQSAILAGEKTSGITSMLMGEGLDDGDMLEFATMDIGGIRADILLEKFSIMARDLTLSTLRNFPNLSQIKQDESKASKCVKIKKDDGEVDFCLLADEIYKKFLAFYPWPGVFLPNKTRLLDIEISDKSGNEGEICEITKDGFRVGCKSGSIIIKTLQEASKKPLNFKDFLNGKRLTIGSRIC